MCRRECTGVLAYWRIGRHVTHGIVLVTAMGKGGGRRAERSSWWVEPSMECVWSAQGRWARWMEDGRRPKLVGPLVFIARPAVKFADCPAQSVGRFAPFFLRLLVPCTDVSVQAYIYTVYIYRYMYRYIVTRAASLVNFCEESFSCVQYKHKYACTPRRTPSRTLNVPARQPTDWLGQGEVGLT